jgi:hypothetical protein
MTKAEPAWRNIEDQSTWRNNIQDTSNRVNGAIKLKSGSFCDCVLVKIKLTGLIDLYFKDKKEQRPHPARETRTEYPHLYRQ